MKHRMRKQAGWIFILLQILVQAAAVVMYFTTGNYQVSYGLFAILLFSCLAGTYLFGFKNMIL